MQPTQPAAKPSPNSTSATSWIASPRRPLVIAGRDDTATPPPHSRELADGIMGAGLLEIPAAGHLAPVERPHAVLDPLRAHFGSASSDDAERHAAGMAVRRAVLGDAHVDRSIAATTELTAGPAPGPPAALGRHRLFSYFMTTTLHADPDQSAAQSAFDTRLQLSQLARIASSRNAAAELAQNYVGVPIPGRPPGSRTGCRRRW